MVIGRFRSPRLVFDEMPSLSSRDLSVIFVCTVELRATMNLKVSKNNPCLRLVRSLLSCFENLCALRWYWESVGLGIHMCTRDY